MRDQGFTQNILVLKSTQIIFTIYSWAILTKSVQSTSLPQNFIKINSNFLMRLAFMSACLQDYHRRLLNTNYVLK